MLAEPGAAPWPSEPTAFSQCRAWSWPVSTTGGGERQGPEGRRTPPRLLHAPERGTYQLRGLGGLRIKVVVSGLLTQKHGFGCGRSSRSGGRAPLGVWEVAFPPSAPRRTCASTASSKGTLNGACSGTGGPGCHTSGCTAQLLGSA